MVDKNKCNNSYKKFTNDIDINDEIPTVSIIIPTYNEEENIAKKIENILEYNFPLNKLEIIIVDDGSLDNTKPVVIKLIKKYNKLIKLRLISSDHQGPANTLKIGTSEANGELILWTDSDAFHTKDNLFIGINHLKNSKIGAVCGTVKPTSDTKDSTVRATGIAITEKIRHYESCIDSVYGTTATFLLFRAKFKNLIHKNINYDAGLALRIRRNGYKILFDENIISYHVEPTSVLIQLKRKKRLFLGLLELSFQNINVNFNPKYGMYGMIIAPRNMLLYILEPVVFIVFLMELFALFKLNIIYLILLVCFVLYILSKIGFRNISLAVSLQLLGYIISFFAYFEFITKKILNKKIMYVPGK
jgi:cellulose synthase/poly-beta-1,6-N-acetylglucosamine synthase-like glycosyltransferase